MKNWKKIVLPFVFAIVLAIGIIIGNYFAMRSNIGSTLGLFRSLGLDKSKISETLSLINSRYVDSVSVNDLTDNTISDLMEGLDPHSMYIPARDIEATNEQLQGSFGGIGVEFTIQRDTILVVSVVGGGPAEKVGVIRGDRIVTVNDTLFVGRNLSNDKVMRKFRGPDGTEIKIGIKRSGKRGLMQYAIVRDEIPSKSITAAYMITPQIGFINVTKFGETTYSEFLTALAKLKHEGAEQFVIDLRGNRGGFMEAAIKMVNEFLPKNEMIVYAAGRSYPRKNFYADGRGSFQNVKLVVLVDELSASASEIFAGAIQDNDRGQIIGRRTFGKGLVQQSFEFFDKSAVRLTVARYYTPSGRCIQKPYQRGKDADYNNDLPNRYLHGEFSSKDSIKVEKGQQYRTRSGRIVYGGGGIMPDLFVPLETDGDTPYLRRLMEHGTILQFSVNYVEEHNDQLKKIINMEALERYLNAQSIANQVAAYAENQGIDKHVYYFGLSRQLINDLAKAYIIRNLFGDDGYYYVINKTDITVQKAIRALQGVQDKNLTMEKGLNANGRWDFEQQIC